MSGVDAMHEHESGTLVAGDTPVTGETGVVVADT